MTRNDDATVTALVVGLMVGVVLGGLLMAAALGWW